MLAASLLPNMDLNKLDKKLWSLMMWKVCVRMYKHVLSCRCGLSLSTHRDCTITGKYAKFRRAFDNWFVIFTFVCLQLEKMSCTKNKTSLLSSVRRCNTSTCFSTVLGACKDGLAKLTLRLESRIAICSMV
jgi:hypothetical protein